MFSTKKAVETFKDIFESFHPIRVISHQETGNDMTYRRDISVKKYLKSKDVLWKEYQNNGVIRGLKSRNIWDKAWVHYMTRPLKEMCLDKEIFVQPKRNNHLLQLDKKYHDIKVPGLPGEIEAKRQLNLFLDEKINDYFRYISQPDKSRYHTSRLSPYITYGNVSIRQIWQTCAKEKTPNPK